MKTRPGCCARYLSSSNSLKVRSSTRPLSFALYVASSTDRSPLRISIGESSETICWRPIASRSRASTSAGPAVEEDVVDAPVGGDGRETALRDDEDQRTAGPGGAEQLAERPHLGEVAPAVDEDHVHAGGVHEGGALGDQDVVQQQAECGEHLGRRLEGVRQEQQRTHRAAPASVVGPSCVGPSCVVVRSSMTSVPPRSLRGRLCVLTCGSRALRAFVHPSVTTVGKHKRTPGAALPGSSGKQNSPHEFRGRGSISHPGCFLAHFRPPPYDPARNAAYR
ncbi:hypothetical protein STANM309S_03641 [Streptomyces tanashiensis]